MLCVVEKFICSVVLTEVKFESSSVFGSQNTFSVEDQIKPSPMAQVCNPATQRMKREHYEYKTCLSYYKTILRNLVRVSKGCVCWRNHGNGSVFKTRLNKKHELKFRSPASTWQLPVILALRRQKQDFCD